MSPVFQLLEQLTKVYRVHRVCSRKPKLRLMTTLKIGLTSRKHKRTEWGFQKIVCYKYKTLEWVKWKNFILGLT